MKCQNDPNFVEDKDDTFTNNIATDNSAFATEKGIKRLKYVETHYSKDLREMEHKLQNDPQFFSDFQNAYSHLLKKAKKMELKIL